MAFFFTYFWLELKRGLKFLPKMVTAACLLCLILGTAAICGKELLYQKEKDHKVKIALSLPEENGMDWMISILEGMDSVKENCEFIKVSTEEEAISMVRKGEAYGAVLVPDGFLHGILNGTNLPGRIILPENAQIESRLIQELTSAGAVTLGAAQAGIYAVTEFYIENQKRGWIPKLERELNMEYLDYALPREMLFRHQKISATKQMTTMEFYLSSACVFFMLLWGVSCSGYFQRRDAFLQKLKIGGINKAKIVFVQIVCLWILLLIILFFMGGCLLFFVHWKEISFSLHWEKIFFCFLAALLASEMIVFCYCMTSNEVAGALLIFAVSSIMMFLAGGLVPQVFLPKGIQVFAPFLPVYYMTRLFGAIFSGGLPENTLFPVFLFLLFLYGGTVFLQEDGVKKWIGKGR